MQRGEGPRGRKGLRSHQGIRLTRLRKLPEPLEARRWDGSLLPRGRRRVRRELLRSAAEPNIEQGRQWRQLRGIGSNGSWLLVMAWFGWRALKTRRDGGG
jgi:hypothetical protein